MEATNHSELWRIRFEGTEGALLHWYSKAPQKVHARFQFLLLCSPKRISKALVDVK